MREVSGKRRGLCAAGRVVVAGVALSGLVGLVGCGSSPGNSSGTGGTGTTGGTPLVSGGATDIYVVESSLSGVAQSILDFSADASGTLTPKTTLRPPTSFQFESLATDGAGNLYVGSAANDPNGNPLYDVLVYAPGASGQATPIRTIHLLAGPGEFFLPLAMTVSAAGKLYVVAPTVVGVFAANVDGDAAAQSAFFLPTGSEPTGIAVDTAGNMYVANAMQGNTTTGQILAYEAGASGNASPSQTITTEGIPYGVTVDAGGNIYTSVNTGTVNSGAQGMSASNEVVEYGGLSSGSMAEVKTIGGAATGVTFATGPQIDEAGNLYLVSEATKESGSTFVETSEIVGFAPTANGNVAPGVVLSSKEWTEAGAQLALH